MNLQRVVWCLAFGLGTAACDVSKVGDLGDSGVYQYTLDYQPGMDFLRAWRSLWQAGAEKCMSDNTIETIRFEIAGVPSPRPAGWRGGATSEKMSCGDLVDGYPYE